MKSSQPRIRKIPIELKAVKAIKGSRDSQMMRMKTLSVRSPRHVQGPNQ
jgi:hypothetical protein